jgi:flagellar biosynthesis/type III secretory pathway protein FliH
VVEYLPKKHKALSSIPSRKEGKKEGRKEGRREGEKEGEKEGGKEGRKEGEKEGGKEGAGIVQKVQHQNSRSSRKRTAKAIEEIT